MYVALALASTVGLAQPSGPRIAPKPNPAQQAQERAAHRAAMTNAKALLLANNLSGAEQALAALNKMKPNTARWNIETAQRLVVLAEELAREAKPGDVSAIASRALQQLAQVDALTTSSQIKGSARTLAGFIQERYLANRSAALASYQAALQLVPTSKQAKEAAERLQQTDEHLRKKLPGGGR